MRTLWKYKDSLPAVSNCCQVSIGEGQTPLIKSRFIGPSLGLKNLYFKLENLNPTGSYKDRFAASFVSTLQQKNIRNFIATSSGNTGAALAAYAGAAGMECFLVIVDGAPLPKIQQMQVYGGKTIMVKGLGLDAAITRKVFALLEEKASRQNVPLPISAYCYCREGMVGVQTIAYEILEELEHNVQHIFCPAGGGGLTLAVAKGLNIFQQGTPPCKVHCVQPNGNNTIAGALRSGGVTATEITYSSTQVSGLQVPGILDGNETLQHCAQSGGTGYLVPDADVFRMQQYLAQKEGVFCEPAGAVSVAALTNAVQLNEVSATDNIVCLITGSGFKNMDAVSKNMNLAPESNKYDVSQLSELLVTT